MSRPLAYAQCSYVRPRCPLQAHPHVLGHAGTSLFLSKAPAQRLDALCRSITTDPYLEWAHSCLLVLELHELGCCPCDHEIVAMRHPGNYVALGMEQILRVLSQCVVPLFEMLLRTCSLSLLRRYGNHTSTGLCVKKCGSMREIHRYASFQKSAKDFAALDSIAVKPSNGELLKTVLACVRS